LDEYWGAVAQLRWHGHYKSNPIMPRQCQPGKRTVRRTTEGRGAAQSVRLDSCVKASEKCPTEENSKVVADEVDIPRASSVLSASASATLFQPSSVSRRVLRSRTSKGDTG